MRSENKKSKMFTPIVLVSINIPVLQLHAIKVQHESVTLDQPRFGLRIGLNGIGFVLLQRLRLEIHASLPVRAELH